MAREKKIRRGAPRKPEAEKAVRVATTVPPGTAEYLRRLNGDNIHAAARSVLNVAAAIKMKIPKN